MLMNEHKQTVHELFTKGWVCLQALLEMKSWFNRFPTILQACESIIEMLRGQYAHCVACYSEAAYHFVEAAKVPFTKSLYCTFCYA